MLRILTTLGLLLVAPLASADTVCVGDSTVACAIVEPGDRFSWYGAYAYDPNTGTFASTGYGEGSGFFADTAAVEVFGYNQATGQWVIFVLAMNDYGRDGDYDDVGLFVGTWNDNGGPAVGEGFYTPLP